MRDGSTLAITRVRPSASTATATVGNRGQGQLMLIHKRSGGRPARGEQPGRRHRHRDLPDRYLADPNRAATAAAAAVMTATASTHTEPPGPGSTGSGANARVQPVNTTRRPGRGPSAPGPPPPGQRRRAPRARQPPDRSRCSTRWTSVSAAAPPGTSHRVGRLGSGLGGTAYASGSGASGKRLSGSAAARRDRKVVQRACGRFQVPATVTPSATPPPRHDEDKGSDNASTDSSTRVGHSRRPGRSPGGGPPVKQRRTLSNSCARGRGCCAGPPCRRSRSPRRRKRPGGCRSRG